MNIPDCAIMTWSMFFSWLIDAPLDIVSSGLCRLLAPFVVPTYLATQPRLLPAISEPQIDQAMRAGCLSQPSSIGNITG